MTLHDQQQAFRYNLNFLKMEPVTVAGDTFTFHKGILTAKSFFGATGKEYLTAQEAKEANPKGSLICVKNVEHGGATELALSIKL